MRQMIFYAMTEAETFDPAITLRSLDDIRAKGFDSIYLEFRNTRAPLQSPRFQTAVSRICAEARRRGLAVVVDASLNHCAADMLVEHPELFTDQLAQHRVAVCDGNFTMEIGWGDPSTRTLENAWVVQAHGAGWQVEEVGAHCRLLTQMSEGGGCAMTSQRGGAVTKQAWAVEGVGSGELLVVTRQRFNYSNRDLGHPAQGEYLDRMCNFAGDHQVAGVVWDEPHFGFDFLNDAYPIADRLYKVFTKRFGYDLRTRLVDLWLDVAGRDSGQVRLDFAELLESQLAILETGFKERAFAHPKLGGGNPKLFVGIHRTMHEELSDDFRIGCIDYFRHTRGLTAGCTDSVFEREDSMLTMLLLARAMAPLSESGEAWNNSWGFRPTAEHLAYYLRLMGCLGVRWLGHAYHGSVMFGPGYPHHPTWVGMPEHLAAHGELLDQLTGATPALDTALLYHWRGLADFPGNYFQQHRRDLLLASLELGVAQSALTLIDPVQLAEAGNRYKRLLVLWPSRLEVSAWTALEQAAAAGVEIFLIGPPAWKSATGTDVSDRWAALAGCQPVVRDAALALPYGATVEVAGQKLVLDPAAAVPNWRSNPANTYPDHAKAWELVGGEPVVRWNGRVIGIRHDNVTTVTTELPQIPGALTALWPVTPVAPAGFLAFAYTRGSDRLLAVTARRAVPVTDDFVWEGQKILSRGCRHGVLRRQNNGVVTVSGAGLALG